jgi:hypothetical protein
VGASTDTRAPAPAEDVSRPPTGGAEPARAGRDTAMPGARGASERTDAATRPAPPRASLDAVYAALHGDPAWRPTTRRRAIGGDELITVGEWAQLAPRDGRIAIAFPSYPPPPAYDVARLMQFLTDAGFRVDVQPGNAFRTP